MHRGSSVFLTFLDFRSDKCSFQQDTVTGVENKPRNYRNRYSKKTVKTQLGAVEVKVPRDRNGEYEPRIIGKYSRNAGGCVSVLCGWLEGLRGSHRGGLSPQPGAAMHRSSDPRLHPLCKLC